MNPRPFLFVLILLCLTASTRLAFGADAGIADAGDVASIADGGAVVAPGSVAAPDPTSDPSGFAGVLIKAGKEKKYFSLACLALFGICLVLRKKVKRLQGDVMGVVTAFGVSFFGMLGTAAMNQELTVGMAWTAFQLAGGAMAVMTVLKKFAVPLLGKTYGAILAGWLKVPEPSKPAEK